eukprot:scaffold233605_cov23-Tisochrysis_lutea.AAC.1
MKPAADAGAGLDRMGEPLRTRSQLDGREPVQALSRFASGEPGGLARTSLSRERCKSHAAASCSLMASRKPAADGPRTGKASRCSSRSCAPDLARPGEVERKKSAALTARGASRPSGSRSRRSRLERSRSRANRDAADGSSR